MAPTQEHGYQSSKHSYAQQSSAQFPIHSYESSPYAGAGFHGYTPYGPTPSVDPKTLSSVWYNYPLVHDARSQNLARPASIPTDIFYTPSDPWRKNWEVASQRMDPPAEPQKNLGNIENQSKFRINTRHSSDLVQDNQYRLDKGRCQTWMEICNYFLADRHQMRYVPEPPHWPCNIHDIEYGTGYLKACACDLRRLYNLLGFQERALRVEQMRWHPDRFSICGVRYRKEIRRTAEELYEKIGIGKSSLQCISNSCAETAQRSNIRPPARSRT